MTTRDKCTFSDHCPHANAAADLAVKKVFAILGVDIDEPKEVEEFRKSLRFGEDMRKAANRGMFAVVSALSVGLAAALWSGITSVIKGP